MTLSYSLPALLAAGVPLPQVAPLAQTTFGQGVLMWLQGIACLLVSVAALVFIFRSLCGHKSRGCCSGHGKRAHRHDGADAASIASDAHSDGSCCGSGKGSGSGRAHGGCCSESAASANGAAHSDAAARGGSAPVAFVTAKKAEPASGATASVASAAAADADAAEEQRLMAVVAASVHVMMNGKKHRIVRMTPVSPGWAQEGRREIFASHRVR